MKVALPGPCSRKLATPVRLSSVRKTSTKAARSAARPSASDVEEAGVDHLPSQGLGRQRALGDLTCQLQRPGQRIVVDDLVGEPDAQRLVGLHLPPGEARLAQQLGPTRRASRCVPPPPGMMPRRISGCPNTARGPAMR